MSLHKFLLKKDKKDRRDFKVSANRLSVTRLPPSVDLRSINPPIYDQGQAGLCFAHAGCRAFDTDFKSETGKFETPSRLFLGIMARNDEGTLSQDAGATMRGTCKAMVKYGIPPESTMPYDIRKMFKMPPQPIVNLASRYQALKYYSINPGDIDLMKQTLASKHDIMFGARIFQSFNSQEVAKSGIVPMPGPSNKDQALGGHALTCLHGDTKISLLDGREISIKEAYAEFGSDNFDVYSCNERQKIVRGNAHSIRKTGTNRRLLKVTLDNNESIYCTPDHKFLMRDGSYKEAQNLQTDDSLMPLYRKITSQEDENMAGYEKVMHPCSQHWDYTHRLVSFGESRRLKGVVTHHKNFNKRDNSLLNLEKMTWSDHTHLHEKTTVGLISYAKSEAGRAKSRELMKNLWADPEWRRKRLLKNSENGTKVSHKLREESRLHFQCMNKEEHRKLSSINGKKNIHTAHTLEARAKRALTRKVRFSNDVEYRERVRQTARKNLEGFNRKVQSGDTQPNICKYHARRKTGELQLTDKQIKSSKLQALKLNYKRWMTDKFPIFEDYIHSQKVEKEYQTVSIVNHKVLGIEDGGIGDVYDLTVDNYHNFALSAGVFVHNCTGYLDQRQAFIVANSWGKWGIDNSGYCLMPYSYFTTRNLVFDIWVITQTEIGA